MFVASEHKSPSLSHRLLAMLLSYVVDVVTHSRLHRLMGVKDEIDAINRRLEKQEIDQVRYAFWKNAFGVVQFMLSLIDELV